MFNLFSNRQPRARREDPDPLAHPVIHVAPARVPPSVVIFRREPIHPTAGTRKRSVNTTSRKMCNSHRSRSPTRNGGTSDATRRTHGRA
jgi:hypothetical protein